MRRIIGLGIVCLVVTALGCGEEKQGPARGGNSTTFNDIEVGSGPKVKEGDRVKIHYTGWLAENDRKFDSSVGKEPFEFTVGGQGAIAGMSDGVIGMQVGGKRKIWIPAHRGYGRQGYAPEIPPDADLIFEVELVSIGK